jgi:hypothetical protein
VTTRNVSLGLVVIVVSVVIVVAAACSDFSVPNGVQIRCSSTADCPDKFKCNAPTSLCVPDDRARLEGPVVKSATATPSDVGLDVSGKPRPLVVDFVLDEDLVATASSLAVVDASGDRNFASITAKSGVEHGFTATYATKGDETQNVPLQIRASLEDAFGNPSSAILPVTVTFDFTPPSLSSPAPTLTVVASVDNPLALEIDTVTQVANASADVTLSFVASEVLANGGVSVTTTPADAGVTFTLVAATGATVQLRGAVSANASDGAHALSATLTDLAGNTATVDLGVTLNVDVHAPAPPDVTTAGLVTLERAPWGRLDATAFAPDDFRVSGAATSVEPDATVIAFRDAAGTREIGRMSANSDGAFGGADGTDPVLLATADLTSVFVRAVDQAGNASAPVQVKDTLWFATLAGRNAGDDLSNPHRLEATPIFAAGRAWDDLSELADADGAGEPDGRFATTTGAGTWERVPTDAIDLPRAVDAALGHDPLRGQTILFGGSGQQNSGDFHDSGQNACGGALQVLFIRERGGPWRQLPVDAVNGPPGMAGARFAFDSDRERLVLVGQSGGGFQQWEWDGTQLVRACTSSQCSASAPTLAASGAVSSFGLAMDPIRHALVLEQQGANGPETWTFDGAKWTQQCTQSPCSDTVPVVSSPLLAFSEQFAEVVLVGGGASTEEVWSFDGTRWLQRCTDATCAASAPPTRPSAAIALDRSRDQIVLFGGSSPVDECSFNTLVRFHQGGFAPQLPLADTWTFDGTKWTQQQPADPPPDRDRASAVWEETEQQVILVGGDDCNCDVDSTGPGVVLGPWQDTRAWDGSDWRPALALTPPSGFVAGAPTATAYHAATHDPASGGALFVGGALPTVFLLSDDRFFAGANGIDPDLSRFGSAFASPSLPGAPEIYPPLLFSGTPIVNTDLGIDINVAPRTAVVVENQAIDICSTGACGIPTPSAFGASAGDGANDVLVFGGIREGANLDQNTNVNEHADNELWLFNGNNWVPVCTASPCTDVAPDARVGARLSPTGNGPLMVLFGGADGANGSAPLADTWLWDGQQWNNISAATSPPARAFAAQAFDPARNTVVVTAGQDLFGRVQQVVSTHAISPALDVVWEFAGNAWSTTNEFDLERDGRPSSRYASAVAWDDRRRGVVVHGGIPSPVLGGGGIQTDVSVALDDAWRWRGGSDLRPAQRFRPSLAAAGFTSDVIDDVTIVWQAAGASTSAGVPDTSLAMFGWDGLGWRALTLTSCGAGCVQWRSSDDVTASELPRFFTGTAQRGSFVLTTTGTNGTAPAYASVATDAVEVRVHASR